MLNALPTLLGVARAILATSLESGDEVDDLRERVEACAVDAHRLLLRRRVDEL
jgi:hypothetical protein